MSTDVFDRFPILSTSRLTLREPEDDDAEALFAWRRDEQAARFWLEDAPASPAAARAVVARWQRRFAFKAEIRWVIASRDDGTPRGACGFTYFVPAVCRGHIVYEIGRDAWGQGLATEAVRAIAAFGLREAGLDRIEAVVVPGNDASARVLQKAGFEEEGLLRAYGRWRGAPRDMRMFSIVRST